MTLSKTKKQKIFAYINEFNTYAPAGETFKIARQCLGISRGRLATRMGIDIKLLTEYESCAQRIPGSIMLKIFMFGLDFWCERDK